MEIIYILNQNNKSYLSTSDNYTFRFYVILDRRPIPYGMNLITFVLNTDSSIKKVENVYDPINLLSSATHKYLIVNETPSKSLTPIYVYQIEDEIYLSITKEKLNFNQNLPIFYVITNDSDKYPIIGNERGNFNQNFNSIKYTQYFGRCIPSKNGEYSLNECLKKPIKERSLLQLLKERGYSKIKKKVELFIIILILFLIFYFLNF